MKIVNPTKHSRSKRRVAQIGEVFTPREAVDEMLDMFDAQSFADPDTVFFEPCCGTGNFVVAILDRRLPALEQHYRDDPDAPGSAPHLAVLKTITSLYAIDIMTDNVQTCRSRALKTIAKFLRSRDAYEGQFITCITPAIDYHIHENEFFSAMGQEEVKTQAGREWVAKHGRHPIDFDKSFLDLDDNV